MARSALAPKLKKTIERIAEFYETGRASHVGFQEYRKTSDLKKLGRCIDPLWEMGILNPQKTIFMDLRCGDGRVNVLMSHFVKKSMGIEIDEDILWENKSLYKKLNTFLKEEDLLIPPGNMYFHRGDSTKDVTFQAVYDITGIRFSDVDIFFTHMTLHHLFGEKIAKEAKKGAYFMFHGISKVLPTYQGLQPIKNEGILEGMVTIYRKG